MLGYIGTFIYNLQSEIQYEKEGNSTMFVLVLVSLMDSVIIEKIAKLLKLASPITEVLIPLLTCMLLTSVFKSAYAATSEESRDVIQLIRATILTIGKAIGGALMKLELCIERPTIRLFRRLRGFFNKVLPRSVSELLAIFLISIILTAII